MKEEEQDHQSSPSAEDSSTRAGEEFNPSDAPETHSPAEPSGKRSVPIGRPVSDQEYRRMKERAANKPNPAKGGHKQQDPSHRKPDK